MPSKVAFTRSRSQAALPARTGRLSRAADKPRIARRPPPKDRDRDFPKEKPPVAYCSGMVGSPAALTRCDAMLTGGGIGGLEAARDLRRRAYAVALHERAEPGRAASWASGGIIGATLRDESDPSCDLRPVRRELWPGFGGAVHSESGLDPE